MTTSLVMTGVIKAKKEANKKYKDINIKLK